MKTNFHKEIDDISKSLSLCQNNLQTTINERNTFQIKVDELIKDNENISDKLKKTQENSNNLENI